jgi:hypothetical protein
MDNYLDKLKSIDDRSIKAMLKVLEFQIKVLGTDVVIEKYDQEGEHRKAFGALFQSDDFTKVKRSTSSSRYVINRNYLNDYYGKQSQPLNVYHLEDELDLGDVVTFTQKGTSYRFKVETKNSYGLQPHIMYRYELMGIPEDTGD